MRTHETELRLHLLGQQPIGPKGPVGINAMGRLENAAASGVGVAPHDKKSATKITALTMTTDKP